LFHSEIAFSPPQYLVYGLEIESAQKRKNEAGVRRSGRPRIAR